MFLVVLCLLFLPLIFQAQMSFWQVAMLDILPTEHKTKRCDCQFLYKTEKHFNSPIKPNFCMGGSHYFFYHINAIFLPVKRILWDKLRHIQHIMWSTAKSMYWLID